MLSFGSQWRVASQRAVRSLATEAARPVRTIPRAVRIADLPEGYDVEKIVGLNDSELERVEKFADHVVLHYYSRGLAKFRVKKLAEANTKATVTLVEAPLVNVATLARLGYASAIRKVQYDSYGPEISEKDIRSRLEEFGPLQSFHIRPKKDPNFNTRVWATFLNESDAYNCFRLGPIGTRDEQFGIRVRRFMPLQTTEALEQLRPRRVILKGLKSTQRISSLLQDIHQTLSRPLGELFTKVKVNDINENSKTVILDFVDTRHAEAFVGLFNKDSEKWGGFTISVENIKRVPMTVGQAISAGASRTISMRLDSCPPMVQVIQEFKVFPLNLGNAHFSYNYRNKRLYITFTDLKEALRVVNRLADGYHSMHERYIGAEFGFARSIAGSLQDLTAFGVVAKGFGSPFNAPPMPSAADLTAAA